MNDTTEIKKRMTPWEAALARPTSAQLAINAFCFQCMGGEGSIHPNVIKASVRDCGSIECRLWHKRPWRGITTRPRKG